jgi:hypothetical protein
VVPGQRLHRRHRAGGSNNSDTVDWFDSRLTPATCDSFAPARLDHGGLNLYLYSVGILIAGDEALAVGSDPRPCRRHLPRAGRGGPRRHALT